MDKKGVGVVTTLLEEGEKTMGEFVKLSAEELKVLHEQNPAMMSYNIEFA